MSLDVETLTKLDPDEAKKRGWDDENGEAFLRARLVAERDKMVALRDQQEKAVVELEPPPYVDNTEKLEAFERDLTALINRYSLENGSNTPDFLLARHMIAALIQYDSTVNARCSWWGTPARWMKDR